LKKRVIRAVECADCGGFGLLRPHVGWANSAVVCPSCGGKGARMFILPTKPFTGRKKPPRSWGKIEAVRCSYCDVVVDYEKFAAGKYPCRCDGRRDSLRPVEPFF